MSSLEIPAFDVLANQKDPFRGFGKTLKGSREFVQQFHLLVDAATIRIEEGFGVDGSDPKLIPRQIDETIREMWATGWTPQSSLNLFVRDFGLVLAGSVLKVLGGELVLRSESELDHMSLWWPEAKIEAFPFHHIVKVLLEPGENSAESFMNGVNNLILSDDSTINRLQ